MRPRVGSRGSTVVVDVEEVGIQRFNEAPSWFSGKCSGLDTAAVTALVLQ